MYDATCANQSSRPHLPRTAFICFEAQCCMAHVCVHALLYSRTADLCTKEWRTSRLAVGVESVRRVYTHCQGLEHVTCDKCLVYNNIIFVSVNTPTTCSDCRLSQLRVSLDHAGPGPMINYWVIMIDKLVHMLTCTSWILPETKRVFERQLSVA